MATAITKKIVAQKVVQKDATPAPAAAPAPVADIVHMNETVKRPDLLIGSTYRIKPATEDHAMYITINDIILNEGTDHEVQRPYEVFVNCKSMEHFQWILALTRVMSAVFRKGGDLAFLVEELRSVYDPKGGYFQKGGNFMPSIVAEIGFTLEKHLVRLGLMNKEDLGEQARAMVAEKVSGSDGIPANATVCTKCHEKSVVRLDGCNTCTSCGQSSCS